MQNCIFCTIIDNKIPTTIIKENDYSLAIKDLNPKAPIHYLILPKKHFDNLLHLDDNDLPYITGMALLIRDIAKTLPSPNAFNIISNNGEAAGQSVFHFHQHLLAGKNIYSSGFTL